MAKYVKPTLDTKFHIDFAWWKQKGQNLKSYLRSHACPATKNFYDDYHQDQTFEWVSPETGEVFQIDLLWHMIRIHCSQQPDFIDEHTPLTSAIFRTFIANDNVPLTPVEIHERLQKKTPELILKTIGSGNVYKGIRPVITSL